MNDTLNLTLDLSGTQVRHAYLHDPLEALANDIDLFRSLAFGRNCVAWFAAPTKRRPRLALTWAPADMPPGEAWVPFYRFRSDHTADQHANRMRYALKKAPILLDGQDTPVDYCAATY